MDKRKSPDRRAKPTPVISRYTLSGRRTGFRRAEDRLRGGYVDRYGPMLLCSLLFIAAYNVLDAFFMIPILENRGLEISPIFHWVIGCFGNMAWTIKFVAISFFIIALCLHSQLRMVKVYLIVIVALYGMVVVYQSALMDYIFS